SLTRADWLEQEMIAESNPTQRDELLEATDLLWLAMLKRDIPLPDMIRQVEGKLFQRALQDRGKTRREGAKLLATSERSLDDKKRGRADMGKASPSGRGRRASAAADARRVRVAGLSKY